MDINGFKLMGSAIVVAGLMTATFVAGGMASTPGRANPEPSVTRIARYEVAEGTVATPTPVPPDQGSAALAEEVAPEQPRQPAQPGVHQPQMDPAPQKVEPSQAPIDPTPVPRRPQPVPIQ